MQRRVAPAVPGTSMEAIRTTMGFQINTNVQAINAQRNLSMTNVKMGKALEKLSSGLRINRAADDAAGLAISEKLRAQIRGMQQATRNSQDGVSMIQTAEGALAEVHSILQRMREVTVQAGNSTLSTDDRTAVGEELLALKNEIDRIGSSTKFNGQALLTGALNTTLGGATATDIVVGDAISNNVASAVDVSSADANTTYTFTYVGATNALTLTNGTTNVAQTITFGTAGVAGEKVLNFDQLGVKLTLVGPAEANADDLGTALVAAADDTIVTAAGNAAATFQVGADSGQTMSVSFTDMRSTAIGSGVGNEISDKITNNQAVSTTALASTLLTTIDDAITDVSTQRGALGASQNRIEHTIAAQGIVVENLSASESRIRDADIASVSSQLVTQQILQQAGVSVLSQANQSPQVVLALLQ